MTAALATRMPTGVRGPITTQRAFQGRTPRSPAHIRGEKLVDPLVSTGFRCGPRRLTVFDYFLSWPRFAFWIPLTAIASIAILKSRRLTPKFLVTMTAVAEFLEVIDYFIFAAHEHRLGYTGSAFDPWVLLITVGAVGLATTVAVTFDESIRSTAIAWVLKDGQYSLVPLVAVFLMMAIGTVPIGRNFAGGFNFAVVSPAVQPGDQELYPGYPTPNLIASSIKFDLRQHGFSLINIDCQYGNPESATTPFYLCTSQVRSLTTDRAEYHDNIQVPGGPDGTYNCHDFSRNVSRQLC